MEYHVALWSSAVQLKVRDEKQLLSDQMYCNTRSVQKECFPECHYKIQHFYVDCSTVVAAVRKNERMKV